jgi:hypothetical protein
MIVEFPKPSLSPADPLTVTVEGCALLPLNILPGDVIKVSPTERHYGEGLLLFDAGDFLILSSDPEVRRHYRIIGKAVELKRQL